MECEAEWNTKTQARLDQLHYCSVELSMLSDPARMRGSRSVSKCENGGNSGDEDGGVDTSGKQTMWPVRLPRLPGPLPAPLAKPC